MKQYKSIYDAKIAKARIKAEMNKLGFTQSQLAQETGFSANYICGIVTGDNGPSVDRIIDFANLFEVPMDYMCGRDDYLNRPITMKDIARALMVLSFLDGVSINWQEKSVDRIIDKETGEKIPDKKNVYTIQIDRGPLRQFLDQYMPIFGRKNAVETKNILAQTDQKLAEIDGISAWDCREKKKWKSRVKALDLNGISENKFYNTVWQRMPFPEIEDND